MVPSLGFACMVLTIIDAWLALQIPLGVLIGTFIRRGSKGGGSSSDVQAATSEMIGVNPARMSRHRAEPALSGSAVSKVAATRSNGELGPEHYRAICDAVGERLGFMVRPEHYVDLPPRLAELMSQLTLLDCEAPSIVPSYNYKEMLLREHP